MEATVNFLNRVCSHSALPISLIFDRHICSFCFQNREILILDPKLLVVLVLALILISCRSNGGFFCHCYCCFCLIALLGIKPRASRKIGKHSTIELHPQPNPRGVLNITEFVPWPCGDSDLSHRSCILGFPWFWTVSHPPSPHLAGFTSQFPLRSHPWNPSFQSKFENYFCHNLSLNPSIFHHSYAI